VARGGQVRVISPFTASNWQKLGNPRRPKKEGVHRCTDVVAVGPFWNRTDEAIEIDVVVLAGRNRETILVGEAKWARAADGSRIRCALERKAMALPRVRVTSLIYPARERLGDQVATGKGGGLQIRGVGERISPRALPIGEPDFRIRWHPGLERRDEPQHRSASCGRVSSCSSSGSLSRGPRPLEALPRCTPRGRSLGRFLGRHRRHPHLLAAAVTAMFTEGRTRCPPGRASR
jgi:hypothetical protein